MSQGEPLIEARGLSKFYGDFAVIREVSFKVPAGSITTFLGPNGAGKTTALRILIGYLSPSAGEAYLAGHNMATERMAGSRELGYLGENGPLYLDMTPAGYLRFMGRMRRMKGKELEEALERATASCFLQEVWNKPIRKLSKGFRQRVGLAQALLHNPRVLILDEPTTGLDPNQIVVVRELIRKFADQNRAVLISTHLLQEVEAIADRVVLIHEGRIRFQGTPKELAGQEGMEARFRALTGGVAA